MYLLFAFAQPSNIPWEEKDEEKRNIEQSVDKDGQKCSRLKAKAKFH